MTGAFPAALPSSVVVVFAKPPEPGRVKTRMTDRLAEETAAELYEVFLSDTARTVAETTAPEGRLGRLLAYTRDSDCEAFDVFREFDFEFIRQGEGDLGAKLARVTDRCFDAGAQRVSIVGTDSPTLRPRHLESGFEALGDCDLVLGPSFDGGYYLIGLRSANTAVFDEIDWSTRRVLAQTVRRAKSLGLLCELIEFWYDVDTFDDLEYLRFHLLEYLARRDRAVAPETSRLLRELETDGVFAEREARGDS